MSESESKTMSLAHNSAVGWFAFVHGLHQLVQLDLAEDSFSFRPLLVLLTQAQLDEERFTTQVRNPKFLSGSGK